MQKARDRWGQRANRPEIVEYCEELVARCNLKSVWDLLGSNQYRRLITLTKAEEILIVKKALRHAARLGQLDRNLAKTLIRLLGGSDHLKTENRIDPAMRAAARAHCRANPQVTLGQLKQRYGFSRDTASKIKKDALSDD